MTKFAFTWSELPEAEKKAGSWDAVRGLLGGKGANLARMSSIGLPVPPGFTITTEAMNEFLKTNAISDDMWAQILKALEETEKLTGKKFGDPQNPLLLSCRSGAKFSMPGMMDTLLNAGLSDASVPKMIELTNERFVWDAYRRLIQGFGAIVLGISDEAFEEPLGAFKKAKGYASDIDMTAADWKELTETFKGIVKKEKGMDFPQDAHTQLKMAVGAVFSSWNTPRAVAYRNVTKIPHDLGTACNIMAMVFGNMGSSSATGVAFTRNPSTGEKKVWGEFLVNAQGEDVVAGVRSASDVHGMAENAELKQAYDDLMAVCAKLEDNFKNMQDLEFTVEQGKLYMLQTRDGKRTARAAVKIAVDMCDEGRIDKETAVQRVSADQVNALLHPMFDPEETAKAKKAGKYLTKGVNASPGAAVGAVVFDANTAEKLGKEEGKDVILVRQFTKPDDVHGFFASRGVLTSEGGATSHAAVVARQFGLPCVCGAGALHVDTAKKEATVGDVVLREGDFVSLNGGTGEVYAGQLPTIRPDFDNQADLRKLLAWADEICARPDIRSGPAGYPTRGLQVWANADYGPDAERARGFGAQGIGLCRTEHQFFEQDRLPVVQEMIVAKSEEARSAALAKLLPIQRSDFENLFRAMDGLPVIIRCLDPPLHEFLWDRDELVEKVAQMKAQGLTETPTSTLVEMVERLRRVDDLHESNPMIGCRGVRLSIVRPEILHMQVRAIFEAAVTVAKEGKTVRPYVMIPLTDTRRELDIVHPAVDRIAKEVLTAGGVADLAYKFGTMIETPRAALVAGNMANQAQFFSFGTNDLTQLTFGISRDDAERSFLVEYIDRRILPANPFQTVDDHGVGRLIRLAVKEGRESRPDLSVGICGEHGGDPQSIQLVHDAGLNYVSCSPFRVPVARLAAAHAALNSQKK